MLQNYILSLYTIGSLILITVCRGAITVFPQNTAVVAGSRAILNCSQDDPNPGWVWLRPDNRRIVFSLGQCSVLAGFTTEYQVSSPSSGSYCNLIILNVTTSDAGSYTCGDGTSSSTAVLLVLDSGPHCSTDSLNSRVVYPDNNHVTMNCSVQFNSPSGWIPTLQWIPSNSPSSGTSYPNINRAYSSFTYLTQASTPIPSYTCSVVYNSSVYVDIPPCSTNPVSIYWCPRAVTIFGAPGGYTLSGSSLTCSASGNPSPTYQWFNSANNLLANDQSIAVYETGYYTCTASNNIKGSQCSTSVSQFVINLD